MVLRNQKGPLRPLPPPSRRSRQSRTGRTREAGRATSPPKVLNRVVVQARITGNPPTITTWIKGVKFMEYTDTKKRLPDRGGIALQVHGGGDYTKQFVRYRNVRVKVLD